MPIVRQRVRTDGFTPTPILPYELRLMDFESAMQDVYDFFHDVNTLFAEKGLPRMEDALRPANLSGMLSDMLTASVAKHSRTLVQNLYFNGHPDLIVQGRYANDRAKAGEHGIEIKATRKKGGAVDTHGGRKQWLCVFVYQVDGETEPAVDRRPLKFTELYLAEVDPEDFRNNERGPLGTRTSTLDKYGVSRLRQGWLYRDPPPVTV